MSDQAVIHIAVLTMIVSAKVAGPILIMSLAVGLGISILQSITQIQEVTLTFVPKLAGIALVIIISGNWMLNQLIGFTHQLFQLIPRVARAGMTFDIPIPQLVGFLLALARTTAWMAVSPPFNSRLMPRTVKLGAAAAISISMAANMPAQNVSLDTMSLIGMLFMQVATGLILGYLTMLLFSAIQAAGGLIDLFGGFTMSQAMDPFSNNQTSVFGRFYQLLAMTLLFAINGHLILIKGFMTSFDAVPFDGVALDNYKTLLIDNVGLFMVAAFEIAGPLMAAYFLADIGLGLLSKAAPQLNILTFGFPFKILLTMLLIASAVPLLPAALETLINQTVRQGVNIISVGG